MENKNNTQESARISRIAARQQKKRAVVSYANMSPELAAAFKEKYPRGYADYMGDIFKVDKPDGSFFYAISLEIPEAIYLIKIDVKIDDYDDVENDIFGDGEADSDGATDGETFPDNDGGSFAGDDDNEE
ncbi:MAG: hypothetical protein IKY70_03500 [Bacteroidales bacterium]|nr:hypothetical protein [Bacteroidales bacterium]